ncbi:MAG: hypothetical protein Q7R64_00855 [bacterium]|nr:hypothetical protein [bacterium]
MRHISALFVSLALVLISIPTVLLAQTGGVGTELPMTVLPEHPRPGEAVEVSVESYNIDLNRAEVQWFVNDKLVKTGLGNKRLTVSAGRNGETTVVRVVAIAENGIIYSASATIRPAEVNLLWQAQSYTPPFYKGKALMPYQGTVLVAAIPSFTRGKSTMSPGSLIYTWSEGDNVIGDSSGKGRNLFVFRGSVPLRTKTISVLVESPDRTMSAEASINVTPVAPRLLFYENHPRYGLLISKALANSFTLSEDETRIDAVPYYFESDTKTGSALLYEWQMNYSPLTFETSPFLILRRASNAAGRTNIFLEVRDTDEQKTFQAAEGKLMIEFPQIGFEASPIQ